MNKEEAWRSAKGYLYDALDGKEADEIIRALEQEPSDTVSRGVFEQVMWERDVAIDQLKELGYGLGEKPKMGRWVLTQRDKDIDINCSACGNTRIRSYSHGYAVDELDFDEVNGLLANSRINYCEYCGTKMQTKIFAYADQDTLMSAT